LTISYGKSYCSKGEEEEEEDPNGMESLTSLCPTNLAISLRSLFLTCNQMKVAPGWWFHNILSTNLSQIPLLERISTQFERLQCDELGTFFLYAWHAHSALPHDREAARSRIARALRNERNANDLRFESAFQQMESIMDGVRVLRNDIHGLAGHVSNLKKQVDDARITSLENRQDNTENYFLWFHGVIVWGIVAVLIRYHFFGGNA